MGTQKQSKAAKDRWSKIPKEKRSELMKKAHKGRKKKWKETTPEERSAHGKKMIAARYAKSVDKGTV